MKHWLWSGVGETQFLRALLYIDLVPSFEFDVELYEREG